MRKLCAVSAGVVLLAVSPMCASAAALTVNLTRSGTYFVPRGVNVSVTFNDGEGLQWSAPVDSSSTVLVPQGTTTSGEAVTTTFTAARIGLATLTATGSEVCSPQPGVACPALTAMWQARVFVEA